jgi:hypothetical protein
MGVTIELQNLGDAELCRDLTARLEHAFSDRAGEWRVTITGSRANAAWELRVEGPNAFERSYALADTSQQNPEGVCRLVLQLLPALNKLSPNFSSPNY